MHHPVRTDAARVSRRVLLRAVGASALFTRSSVSFALAPAKQLEYPVSIAIDSAGAIYLADLQLPGIWKAVDGKLTPFYAAEKKFREPLAHPRAVVVIEKDALVVTDTAARDVFLVRGSEKPRGLTGGKLDVPSAIVVSGENLIVADTQQNRLWRGAITGEWAKWIEIPAPRALALDAQGAVYVVSGRDNVLYRVESKGGKPVKVAQGESTAYWSGVAIAADGTPVVVDSYAKTLWRIEKAKPVEWVKGEPLDHPVSIVHQGEGFYVVDSRAKAIFQVGKVGKVKKLELQAS